MEVWVEKCGQGAIEISSCLPYILPRQDGGKMSCIHLELEADVHNIFGCAVRVRYEGSVKWNILKIPDQVCPDVDSLIRAVASVKPFNIALDGTKGNLLRVWVESYANNKDPIEFSVSQPLGAILGLEGDKVYTGEVFGIVRLDALVDTVAVLSPLTTPDTFAVNTCQFPSLGVFASPGRSSSSWNQLANPSPSPFSCSHLAPLSSFLFTVNSFNAPSAVLFAKAYRLRACFAFHFPPPHQR